MFQSFPFVLDWAIAGKSLTHLRANISLTTRRVTATLSKEQRHPKKIEIATAVCLCELLNVL